MRDASHENRTETGSDAPPPGAGGLRASAPRKPRPARSARRPPAEGTAFGSARRCDALDEGGFNIFDTIIREGGLYGAIQIQAPTSEAAQAGLAAIRTEFERLPTEGRTRKDFTEAILSAHGRLRVITESLGGPAEEIGDCVVGMVTLLSQTKLGFDIVYAGFLRVLLLRRGQLLLPVVQPHERVRDDVPYLTSSLGGKTSPSIAFTSAAAEGGDLFGIAGRSIIAIPADELKTQLSRARTEDVAGALGKRVGAMVTIPVPGPLPGPRIGAAERLEWAAQSSVGMRTGNEDAYQADAEAGFFVVGDGLGGHEFGEEASQTAVATAAEVYAAEAARVDGSETAGRAFELAGSRVARKTGSGGSTLDVVRIRRGRAEIAHVGDSRVYLFRGSHLGQLTDDDSVVGDLIRRGLLTPEEARKDSRRNILTRAVDRNCWPPFYDVLDLSDHDILLLCSDGLTGPVPDDRIEAILESARGDIARAASELVAAAYESGAPDNVTVLLVRFREGRVARRVSRQRQLRRNTDRPAASPGRKLAR